MKYIEISKENLLHNIQVLKQRIKKGVLFCAVVKANAYGHGFEICKLIEDEVDYFAVATANEGLKLRSLGIVKPILVLGVTSYDEKRKLIKANIDITVCSKLDLYQIIKTKCRVHLKVNTGMNRLGFSSLKEFKSCLKILKGKPVKCVGVFSHFFDGKSKKECNNQNEIFKQFIKLMDKKTICHISSTDAVFTSRKYNHSMVRCGIGIYGYSSYEKANELLKPVMKVYAEVLDKKKVKEGEFVGYSRKYKADAEEEILTLNCGYFDGISRLICNKKISTKEGDFTVCGNICMDMMMIKNENAVRKGESVCIFDNANQIAKLCSTIPYEILTNIKRDRFDVIIK